MTVKVRVIPTLLWSNDSLVKPFQFNSSYRTVGSMMQAVEVYENREVDELIILDIEATPGQRRPRFKEVKEFTERCFMPVTIGGGVSGLDDVQDLLRSGADKVSICTAAVLNPDLVFNAARKFGSQAIVGVVDVAKGHLMTHCGNVVQGLDPSEWAKVLEVEGAGEILLTSVDRDGVMEGYDLALIEKVASRVTIPIIANGGCGTPEHMVEALKAGADAVAASSMFLFTDMTPRDAMVYLTERGFPTRMSE